MIKIKTLVLLAASLFLIALIPGLSGAGETREFEIKADNFKFIPETITVKQGDKVVIKALAVDKDHGIGIKAFGVKELMPKGEWITVEFVADKKGEHTIQCTKYCGWKHFFMKGKLIVE